ncbi:MAG: M48 family metalloprotease [Myxococcales bacterium]|nr:M48 family metalloprotease [Myxococcales bacterium]
MTEPVFTAAELAEVKAYHAPRYTFEAVDSLLWPIVLVLVVRFLTGPLYRVAVRLTSRWRSALLDRVWKGKGWGPTTVFALLLFAIFSLVTLPTDIWFGFVREHQYGLSTTSPWVFALDSFKAHLFTAVAVLALAFGLFGLARRLTHWWWVMGLVATVVMSVSAALDPYRSRLYIEQQPLPDGPLRARILALTKQAKVEVADVLVDETLSRTVRLQAYFAGTGPTRTIVLNDALLKNLSEDEILAAVAHESGHVHESRWPARVMSAVSLFAFLGLVEWLFRRSAKRGWFGISERADIRTLPLILLVFDLSMTAAGPLSGLVSRRREWAADRYAMTLTRNPESFSSMLVKAARVNKMDPEPPRWLVLKGMSHPPIGERIEFARRFQTR